MVCETTQKFTIGGEPAIAVVYTQKDLELLIEALDSKSDKVNSIRVGLIKLRDEAF